jgi:2-oxoglutarate ferredoxin oxidoreductase subunit gamma
MLRKEILISGFGGQGVVLAGRILGYAAVLENLHVTMLISHGTETRGGYVRSQVVISDETIDSPIVESPDIFCAMSQSAYDRFFHLTKKGIILYDSDLVAPVFMADNQFQLAVPARTLSIEKFGTELSSNIIMLGVILQKLNIISLEHGRMAVEEIVPRSKEGNRNALETGFLI